MHTLLKLFYVNTCIFVHFFLEFCTYSHAMALFIYYFLFSFIFHSVTHCFFCPPVLHVHLCYLYETQLSLSLYLSKFKEFCLLFSSSLPSSPLTYHSRICPLSFSYSLHSQLSDQMRNGLTVYPIQFYISFIIPSQIADVILPN